MLERKYFRALYTVFQEAVVISQAFGFLAGGKVANDNCNRSLSNENISYRALGFSANGISHSMTTSDSFLTIRIFS